MQIPRHFVEMYFSEVGSIFVVVNYTPCPFNINIHINISLQRPGAYRFD